MNCDNCQRDQIGAGALHRASPKGELPAVWLCSECGGRSPKDVQEIIDAIRRTKPAVIARLMCKVYGCNEPTAPGHTLECADHVGKWTTEAAARKKEEEEETR